MVEHTLIYDTDVNDIESQEVLAFTDAVKFCRGLSQ